MYRKFKCKDLNIERIPNDSLHLIKKVLTNKLVSKGLRWILVFFHTIFSVFKAGRSVLVFILTVLGLDKSDVGKISDVKIGTFLIDLFMDFLRIADGMSRIIIRLDKQERILDPNGHWLKKLLSIKFRGDFYEFEKECDEIIEKDLFDNTTVLDLAHTWCTLMHITQNLVDTNLSKRDKELPITSPLDTTLLKVFNSPAVIGSTKYEDYIKEEKINDSSRTTTKPILTRLAKVGKDCYNMEIFRNSDDNVTNLIHYDENNYSDKSKGKVLSIQYSKWNIAGDAEKDSGKVLYNNTGITLSDDEILVLGKRKHMTDWPIFVKVPVHVSQKYEKFIDSEKARVPDELKKKMMKEYGVSDVKLLNQKAPPDVMAKRQLYIQEYEMIKNNNTIILGMIDDELLSRVFIKVHSSNPYLWTKNYSEQIFPKIRKDLKGYVRLENTLSAHITGNYDNAKLLLSYFKGKYKTSGFISARLPSMINTMYKIIEDLLDKDAKAGNNKYRDKIFKVESGNIISEFNMRYIFEFIEDNGTELDPIYDTAYFILTTGAKESKDLNPPNFVIFALQCICTHFHLELVRSTKAYLDKFDTYQHNSKLPDWSLEKPEKTKFSYINGKLANIMALDGIAKNEQLKDLHDNKTKYFEREMLRAKNMKSIDLNFKVGFIAITSLYDILKFSVSIIPEKIKNILFDSRESTGVFDEILGVIAGVVLGPKYMAKRGIIGKSKQELVKEYFKLENLEDDLFIDKIIKESQYDKEEVGAKKLFKKGEDEFNIFVTSDDFREKEEALKFTMKGGVSSKGLDRHVKRVKNREILKELSKKKDNNDDVLNMILDFGDENTEVKPSRRKKNNPQRKNVPKVNMEAFEKEEKTSDVKVKIEKPKETYVRDTFKLLSKSKDTILSVIDREDDLKNEERVPIYSGLYAGKVFRNDLAEAKKEKIHELLCKLSVRSEIIGVHFSESINLSLILGYFLSKTRSIIWEKYLAYVNNGGGDFASFCKHIHPDNRIKSLARALRK